MRRNALEWASRLTLAFIITLALVIVYLSARALDIVPGSASPAVALTDVPSNSIETELTDEPTQATAPLPASTPEPSPTTPAASTPTPWPTPTVTPGGPAAIRIGIVAGHHGYDPGATCPDGLREVDINLAVAERVIARLARRGYTVELLSEFDDRLTGYQADVFLSIHSDSCIPGLTGFKIARSETSAIPEVEDQLVDCIIDSYSEQTGLSFHANSISEHMRDYHAFRKIASDTPGAIMELGFMNDDRNVLLYRQDRLARGLVDGIQCFLNAR